MLTPPVLNSNEIQYEYGGKKEKDANHQGKLAVYSVEWLSNAIQYTGIFAILTAISSIFLLRSDESQVRKIGRFTGNCYIIAEIVLIVAIIAIVALKISIKLRS